MDTPEPDFRLSLLDAASDYLDAGTPDAAVRALRAVLERSEDDRVAEWIARAQNGSEAALVAHELRAEVARIRNEQMRSLLPDSPLAELL